MDRNRYLVWVMAGRGPGSFEQDLREYVDNIDRLYRALAAASGAQVLVDTSKNAPYAWLLRLVPSVQLQIMHLLRDSHGVAYAWAKQGVSGPEVVAESVYMDRLPVAACSALDGCECPRRPHRSGADTVASPEERGFFRRTRTCSHPRPRLHRTYSDDTGTQDS